MSRLSRAQKEAITHKDGPMMVLAGPGSGKTLVITKRVQYLIGHYKVRPEHILVITFTRAAASEMKERFQRLAGKSLPVSFGTFHSVFFTILKHAYGYRAENILPESKKYDLIREIIYDCHLEIDDEGDFIRSVIQEISLVKGQMLSLDYYYSSSCGDDVFRQLYESYEKKLHANRWIDFDDILVYTYELLKERKDIRSAWQKKFPYILIDEFQDINKVQYEIVRMLSEPNHNLFIVGDDDQSIYKFRGARPELMLGFPKDYPEAKQVTLNLNFRSGKEIVELAEKIICHNEKRFPKAMESFQGELHPVEIRRFKDQREENRHIVYTIREEMGKKTPLSQIAVLTRTNQGPRQLIGALMAYNIPFCMRDAVPNLFDHWIAKNIIDYMRLAMGDRRRSTFLRVMNRPKRYISREYLTEPEVSFDDLLEKTKDKPWLYDYIEEMKEDIRILSRMSPKAAITYIRKSIGYNAYLSEYARFRRMQEEELTQVLEELQDSAKGFDTYEEWFDYIREYTQELNRQSKKNQEEKNGIILSTMHSAKGLEFERVFLPDVNEDVIPYKKSIKEEDIEEERRMFYVAVTRAKKYLHVFSTEKLYNKESRESRFLTEIRKEDKTGEGYV
ncbi:MAG TPA: ATP-dependent helicase [Candidatus Anaerostipes excrementavium]|uniref:DNA 3'-5' helicase n=1 Tax=Candidatus Anaerostipes excrementavium TaxID=2838463 RepID=A0A9D2BAN2_9FIRM|nr:ATP-dependent helicase [uncultured Anaerostipes sp.]HIX68457.1 ATP-dependent helicase [Candidatus Anaerostipes excrementavium]